jgi:putative flippase GtrA
MSLDDPASTRRLGALLATTQTRYLVVGAWNTFFGVALFATLLWLFGDHVGYWLILLVCQVIATVQSHWAQRTFVWRSRGAFLPELLRFSLVYIASYFVNLGLLALCVEVLGWPVFGSQLAITVLMVALTYTVNRLWTFRHAGAPTPPAPASP